MVRTDHAHIFQDVVYSWWNEQKILKEISCKIILTSFNDCSPQLANNNFDIQYKIQYNNSLVEISITLENAMVSVIM